MKILNSLNYDFRDFTIEGFISWIEGVKGRKILTFGWQMPAGLFGAWMSDLDCAFQIASLHVWYM